MRRTEALNPKAEMCGVVSDGPAIRLVFCAFGPRLAPVRLELIYCVFTDYKYRNYHCTLWRGPQRQLPLRPYTDILAILSFCTPAHTIFFLLFFFCPFLSVLAGRGTSRCSCCALWVVKMQILTSIFLHFLRIPVMIYFNAYSSTFERFLVVCFFLLL